MESMRLLQRNALRQLFETRPLTRRALNQATSLRFGRPVAQQRGATRSIHTPRYTQRSIKSGSTFTQQASSSARRCRNSKNGNGRRYNSTTTSPPEGNLSIRDRLKKLSREYGWSAVGVYLALSALDFPFCFLAVRTLGTDRIGRWEHAIVDTVKGFVKWPFAQSEDVKAGIDGAVDEVEREVLPPETQGKRILEEDEPATRTQSVLSLDDHGYKEAEKANSGDNASLWTQLALAYAIHKSFIFVRVPLTAAILPKVVKTLRGWGWNIGKVPSRKAVTGTSSTSGTGVNTKGAKVKGDD
ncbi:hypothetical protein EDD37DRAFT_80256 [Exophiala viscosa]|uniref:DUF1279 domain-containing protein n=1 Tax=Exophiala viscosa TaxID=2486360 RepID=A0AAN6IFR7_9EURO|nr:hypothetical protein EDD36DRAFT_461285 [Exophiala viscosa]KAI1630042.1 hypothetical protein EDD37DRAFT_80256 [Exophiala viscosa]